MTLVPLSNKHPVEFEGLIRGETVLKTWAFHSLKKKNYKKSSGTTADLSMSLTQDGIMNIRHHQISPWGQSVEVKSIFDPDNEWKGL